MQGDVASLMRDLLTLTESSANEARKLSAILPPPLEPAFEVIGDSLLATARRKHGVDENVSIPTLPADERYALFESVFYDTAAVAAKQRIYIPYLDRDLTRRFPFLDLGCGRGEFLSILRGEGIAAIGVDINESNNSRLRSQGFDVVSDDLVAFLERDPGTYSGAAVLQVVEHLTFDRIERMLEMLHARLAPGALLLLETPNPLSTFALSVFHSDPTHVRPLPPEALRYAVEAAGFARTRTLYQARIPLDQFAGPDPRAYYADYAIIALRSSR
jgi:O-antigen chain-terminating methyltransferase